MTDATSVHRALGDDRRAAIVDALRRAGPLDVHELGRQVWLHPNTVRSHLALLREAGLVTSRPTPEGRAGRPRILYSVDGAAIHDVAAEQRWLAAILSTALEDATDGPALVERAGHAWGRRLVERPAGVEPDGTHEVPAALVSLLRQVGFEPEARYGRILMRRCPFQELARVSPRVVCAVHRGLITGALEQLGGTVELDAIEFFFEPFVCIARLRRPRKASEVEAGSSER